jgi:hypothetical protein
MRNLTKQVAMAIMLFGPGAVQAAPVTLDFTSGTYSSGCDTYTQSGFAVATVIPPSGGGHTDGCTEVATGIFGDPDGNIMLSFHNHNPSGAVSPLRVSFAGGTLDLNSIEIPLLDIYGGSGNPQGLLFTASSGDTLLVAAGVTGIINFGAGFDNVDFVQFEIAVSGLPLIEHAVDSFVVEGRPFVASSVPEPMTLSLLGAGFLGLARLRHGAVRREVKRRRG